MQQGDEITEERRANLTDDEADDLGRGFCPRSFRCRDVRSWSAWLPNVVCVTCSTRRPARLSTYLDIIDFCGEPQTFKAIEALVHQTDAGALIGASGQPLQPSYFVDMLERSGGLVWDKGWKATGKGSAPCEAIAGPRWPFRTW